MEKQIVDIAIVGAGAAGLMTAIGAGRSSKNSLNILLLDSKPKIGAKILMSGGTRCNVTHKEIKVTDYFGGPSHFVKHVFKAFPSKATIELFKEMGVELTLESTGKYFPTTHSAKSVLNALVNEVNRLGVVLKTGIRITQMTKEEDLFVLKSGSGDSFRARKVILTTGGLSHPTTGSDGTGYKIAESLGHTVKNTYAALTPLLTNDQEWKALSGLSLPTKLSFFSRGKKQFEYEDPFLFTHFGFSGPVALNISRHVSISTKEENPQIFANFIPDYTEESFRKQIQIDQQKNPTRLIKNILNKDFCLPERFVDTLMKKANASEDQSIGKCPSETRKKLIRFLVNYPLEVIGVYGFNKAEVTVGGVDLKEVQVSTMESKLIKNLYFSGEILDVDGRIGGFNFQWAWSTGMIAGRSAAS